MTPGVGGQIMGGMVRVAWPAARNRVPPPRRSFTVGVRVKGLASVLLLTALGMALAGATLVLVQRSRIDERADRTITHEVTEFRSNTALDLSQTTDVGTLLRMGLQREAPAEDESYLGLIDGRPAVIPAGERLVKLEAEPAVMNQITGLPANAPVKIRTADTRAGPVRFAAVPVQVPGQPEVGTYVAAVVLKPAMDRVMESTREYILGAVG